MFLNLRPEPNIKPGFVSRLVTRICFLHHVDNICFITSQGKDKPITAEPEQESNTAEDKPVEKKVVTEAPSGEEMEGREVDIEETPEKDGQREREEEGGWMSWGTKPATWGMSGISNVTHAVQKTVSVMQPI